MLLSPFFLLIHPDTKTRMDLKLSSLMWYDISKQRLRYSGKWLDLCFFLPFFLTIQELIHGSMTIKPGGQMWPEASEQQLLPISTALSPAQWWWNTTAGTHISPAALTIDEFQTLHLNGKSVLSFGETSLFVPVLGSGAEEFLIHWNPRTHRRTTERM